MLQRRTICRIPEEERNKAHNKQPLYPQSNGLAEAYIKVVKNMMKKAQKCKVRFNEMLYQYRTSPVAGKQESPIELLEQWRPRTNMPYLGKGDPKVKPTPYYKEPKINSHKYPVGASVMHHIPPGPSYYTVWYPAKIKTLLKEPKSIPARKQRRQSIQAYGTTYTPIR